MGTEIQRKQNLLSERLLLLQQFDYQQQLDYHDLSPNYYGRSSRRKQDIRRQGAIRDARHLDTVAAALTTRSSGEVYAAAFDKRQRFGLVLAKNDPLTEEDRAAAKEFISLIQSPKTNDWDDLFPFLIKRCSANINNRIEALAASMTGSLLQDFTEGLRTYAPNEDLQSEVYASALKRYGDGIPTFSVVWTDYIQDLIERCKALDLTSDVLANKDLFANLYATVRVVLDSRFLKWFIDNKRLYPEESRMRVEKFKRRLAKCCQYVDGIDQLICKAKRLPPISHEWVTIDSAGSGQGAFSIASPSTRDAIETIVGQPLNETVEEKVTTIFDPKAQNWKDGAKGIARIHAELLIILHFGPSPHSSAHAIGVSKRSCLSCALWIRFHNDIFGTQWIVDGSHARPRPDWALPGGACAYQSGDRVDKVVMNQVYQRLLGEVKSLIPGKHNSEESSGVEENRREYIGWILKARKTGDFLPQIRKHDSTVT